MICGPGARMQSSQTLKRGQSSQCKKLSKPCRPGSAQRRRGTRGGGGGAHVAAPPRSAEASRRTRAKRCKWLGNRSAHECADFQEREVAHPLRTCGGRYCTCAPRACAGSGRTAVRECSQTQASGQMTRASPAYAWARGPNSLALQLSHGTPHARARGGTRTGAPWIVPVELRRLVPVRQWGRKGCIVQRNASLGVEQQSSLFVFVSACYVWNQVFAADERRQARTLGMTSSSWMACASSRLIAS